MKIDKPFLQTFRGDVNKILGDYGQKHGLQISLGNIQYEDMSFSVQLKVVVAGNKEEAEKVEFERNIAFTGLKKEDYGKEFECYGNRYNLVGYRPKSAKYPLVVKKEGSDKRFKLPFNDYIKKELGIKEEV